MWRNCNPHALLKGIENGPAIMENSLEVPQKFKISSAMIFSISTSDYSSEENEVNISKRYLYPSFIAVHLQQLRHGNNPSVL